MRHANYGWLITEDHLAEPGAPSGTNQNAVGVIGPRDIDPAIEARLKAGEGDVFQMLDSDGELYYAGIAILDETSCDGFEPLTDYGSPNAGASDIRYRRGDGSWDHL
jgi:hypothetical protein